MIIPKAIFLRNTYIKAKENFENESKMQTTLMVGVLTRILRNPQIHKLGAFSYFFPADTFSLLLDEAFDEYLIKIQKDFEGAGYLVILEKEPEGVLIHLDWRGNPSEYSS